MTTSVEDVAGGIEPIKHQSISDRVTEQLRVAVLTGALKPGEQVSIVDLAGRFRVSHIPVREAMRRLDSQGLIVLRPGRSATIAEVGSGDLRAIYRLRTLLEVDLAVRSASMLTEEDLAEATRHLQHYGEPGISASDLSESHHHFHLALLHPASNDWDRRLLLQLWDAASRYFYLAYAQVEGQNQAAEDRVGLHSELLAAVRSVDPIRIAAEWRRHLEESEEMIRHGLAAITLGGA